MPPHQSRPTLTTHYSPLLLLSSSISLLCCTGSQDHQKKERTHPRVSYSDTMSHKGAVAACIIGLFITALLVFSVILLCNRRKQFQTSPRWFPEWVPNWIKNEWNAGRARLDSIDDAWNQSLVSTQIQGK